MKQRIENTILELKQGDITEQKTDAVVNAANSQLILGGGVAGAIRRKGGPSIQAECDRKGPISVGQAILTTAGNLKARYVIHAVGPRMGEGDEDRKLRDAVANSLAVADKNRLKSISFCAISTGIFEYPIEKCAAIMLRSTVEHLKQAKDTSLRKIVFCLYDQTAFDLFEAEFERICDEGDFAE